MTSLKETIRNVLPAPALTLYRDLQDAAAWPAWQFSEKGRRSRAAIAALRNQHKGERCFILGNGPSLRNTDLGRLKNECTIGLNRIYLAQRETGFVPTYLACVNSLVLAQCAEEIATQPMTKFLGWRDRNVVPAKDAIWLLQRARPQFSENLANGIWEGATVTYVAMQIAFHLGFEKVILIGVDHSFVTAGKPHAVVESQSDDPNHFHPGYFGKGFKWQLPDLELSEIAYAMAREKFRKHGREIVDATIGGKLPIFPKVAYEALF